ncbi:hypothetical protein ABTH22_20110, partial [Acinetobacter baumannii]
RLLGALGLPGALAPQRGAGAEALAAARFAALPAPRLGARLRVWLLRAEEGNPALPRLLAAAAELEEAVLYRTVPAGP